MKQRVSSGEQKTCRYRRRSFVDDRLAVVVDVLGGGGVGGIGGGGVRQEGRALEAVAAIARGAVPLVRDVDDAVRRGAEGGRTDARFAAAARQTDTIERMMTLGGRGEGCEMSPVGIYLPFRHLTARAARDIAGGPDGIRRTRLLRFQIGRALDVFAVQFCNGSADEELEMNVSAGVCVCVCGGGGRPTADAESSPRNGHYRVLCIRKYRNSRPAVDCRRTCALVRSRGCTPAPSRCISAIQTWSRTTTCTHYAALVKRR